MTLLTRSCWTRKACLANWPFLLVNPSLDVRPAASFECCSKSRRWRSSATPAEFWMFPAATAAAHCPIPWRKTLSCCSSPDHSWVHLLMACISCCSRNDCFNTGFQDSSIKRQNFCWLVQFCIHVFTLVSQPRQSSGLKTRIRQGKRMTYRPGSCLSHQVHRSHLHIGWGKLTHTGNWRDKQSAGNTWRKQGWMFQERSGVDTSWRIRGKWLFYLFWH